jgi:pSer/pThr/pTyr-binding forkhead associated (FHA) protein
MFQNLKNKNGKPNISHIGSYEVRSKDRKEKITNEEKKKKEEESWRDGKEEERKNERNTRK